MSGIRRWRFREKHHYPPSFGTMRGMLRHMGMEKGTGVVALTALAVVAMTSCGRGVPEGAKDGRRAVVQYGIHYTVGVDAYDDKEATRLLRRCADLPGAELAAQDDSLPPAPSIEFSGTSEEQRRLVECLEALPDSDVNGPYAVPTWTG